jgi:2-dehydropantoate 2-reductase
MGAGAVGCYFGGMLARAGAPVTLIGRREHVEAFARQGLFLDSVHFQERVAVGASTQPDAASNAELVLFAVKTLDTEHAARALAPHLAPGAIVVSLQNGVDNVERIRAAAGFEALPAVVYIAASMSAPGCVKHLGRGDLILGWLRGWPQRRHEIERVMAWFARAEVPCKMSESFEGDLWAKFIANCAGNAVTTLGRANYGRAARNEWVREVMRTVGEEAMAVARAAGVALPDGDLASTALKVAEALGEATSSTAQDIARGKRTEMDSLNGYLVRRGRELGVPVPVNFTLYALMKLLEEAS